MTTMGQTWDQLTALNWVLPKDCLVRTLVPVAQYRRGDGVTRFNDLRVIPLNPLFSMLWDMSLNNQAALSGVSTAANGAATAAQSSADAAQGTADDAKARAVAAQATADQAKTNAASAQTTADTAKTNAAAAQSTADQAKTSATNAGTSATAAQASANTAQTTADTAKTNAQTAQTTANTAQSTANTASTAANAAQATANTAVTNAQTAQTRADNAYALAVLGQNLPTTAIKTQVAVTNTVAETTLVQLGNLTLTAGSTVRVKAAGTIQAGLLTPALTFKVYIGNTPASQTLTLGGSLLGTLTNPVPFTVEFLATIRTSSTYIASGYGRVDSTVLGAATSTTTALGGNPLGVKLTGQWGSANAAYKLNVEVATVEQIA